MTNAQINRRALGASALGVAAAVTAPTFAQAAPPMDKMPRMPMLSQGEWMTQVKEQHKEIVRHFELIKATTDRQMPQRMQYFKMLATLLTGHSIAEEVALYPGLAMVGDTAGSDKLYAEQSHAKVMVAELDAMPKSGPEFLTRLSTLQSAIMAHATDEETRLYPELLQKASPAMNQKMTTDFRKEFNRYMA